MIDSMQQTLDQRHAHRERVRYAETPPPVTAFQDLPEPPDYDEDLAEEDEEEACADADRWAEMSAEERYAETWAIRSEDFK